MTASEKKETGQGHYVRANGLDIYYEEAGQGPPLVLIHGGGVNGRSWRHYIEAFARHFRVIMPDSRGHGRTLNPDGPLSYRQMADDVAAFVKELALEKPAILGYSDGGQVTLEIGMRYPDLPGALVIGGAYPELTEPSRKWVRSIFGEPESPEIDFEKLERQDPEWVGMLKLMHGEDRWKTLMLQIKPLWNATLNYTPEDFARVTAPALVLLADRDEFVSVEEALTMFRQLPNAELAVLPNSDHVGFIISPERVALLQPIIIDFLLRHAGEGRTSEKD